MNNASLKEIKSITFGVYSADDIKNMSVCHICNTRKNGEGSVYDPRLGVSLNNTLCITCGEGPEKCTGHFGHIEFAVPILHPLYYRTILNFLTCICFKCNRLMLTEDQINIKGLKTFDSIVEQIKKTNICCREDCECEKSSLKFSTSDNCIYMFSDDNKSNMSMSTEEIFSILDKLPDEDVRTMGFKPEVSHPRNYIIKNLPVIPPVGRPFVQVNGNIWDDDLTVQYIEIIKTNENIKKEIENENSDTTKYEKFINSLIFRVSTTFNNTQCKAKHTTNARPIKGIKERLAGKDGQIRNNMMGKRVNHSARTVIGPDPTLKSGEIAIPVEMAKTLTIPVTITTFNIAEIQNLLDNGLIKTLRKNDTDQTQINITRYRLGTRLVTGDIINRNGKKIHVKDLKQTVQPGDTVIRNGKFIENIKESNRYYKLEVGMVVDRPLKNGDIVLLNRQPTLHKGSMMAMRIVIRESKTVRMNLAICKSFNADFDGDEMNIHVPQGLESQTELEFLSAAKYNIISAQSSKPNIAIVQDSLLGAFRMTNGIQPITKCQFYDISMVLTVEGGDTMKRIQEIRKVLKLKGKKTQCFNGKGIISLFLPADFNYEHTNNASEEEPTVKITNGVLWEGVFDKSVLGSSHSSLIHIINKEYGPDSAMNFVDCIHFATNKWLMIHGFSVGLGDCLVTSEDKQTEIHETVKKCYIEASGIQNTTTHPAVREIRVNASLNKAKDVGLRLAKDSLDKKNNFLSTVKSGSKGDFFNIAQITGLLGQQNLKGQRVELTMNNGTRSLPHYPRTGATPEMEYESRGFISSSFIHGLNPRQFYFHAMSGREGITDTAMGTATSGYMQRRIVKLTEDIKIHYDGTVRDSSGKIYQTSYGYSGIDPVMTTKVNGAQEVCNISRIVGKLNSKFEN